MYIKQLHVHFFTITVVINLFAIVISLIILLLWEFIAGTELPYWIVPLFFG